MRVQRVRLPGDDKVTWMVLGDDLFPIDPSENSQANIYKALRPFLADSVSTKKSGFDIVTDSLEQKDTESCPTKT